jgi:hypothetical protein
MAMMLMKNVPHSAELIRSRLPPHPQVVQVLPPSLAIGSVVAHRAVVHQYLSVDPIAAVLHLHLHAEQMATYPDLPVGLAPALRA